MQILVDTGVLLRAFDRADAQQRTIFLALRKLWSDAHELVTSSQNIAEFWNVSTRPAGLRSGSALPIALVEQRVQVIERLGTILPFTRQAYDEWRRLLIQYQIVGVAVHDARLVATMLAGNINAILTLNGSDFQRYEGITVLTPAAVNQSKEFQSE